MKKHIRLVTLLLITVLAFSLVGCDGSATAEIEFEDEHLVVFRVTAASGNATVLDALEYLKNQGKIRYETQSSSYGAYITKVNGVSEETGYSWMVYTNDVANSSTDFGALSYAGEILGQTANGISTQTVKSGCLYALSFDSWVF